MSSTIRLTFLGTGTSQGVPVIGCDCPVCSSPDPRDQRLRCSVLIETQGKVLVIDTGPDFRQQMLRADVRQLDAVLMTHQHKDHIAGLDDVRAYNFRQRRAMPVWADALTQAQLRQEFSYAFDGTNYPGIPQIALHDLPEVPFEVEGVAVTPVHVLHHRLPVWGFRFGDLAYVTDASFIPEASKPLLRGLDVLILNALRLETHISHFNLAQALEVVAELQPRRAYFTHISHLLGRHADVEATLPPHVRLAYDGLVLNSPEVRPVE